MQGTLPKYLYHAWSALFFCYSVTTYSYEHIAMRLQRANSALSFIHKARRNSAPYVISLFVYDAGSIHFKVSNERKNEKLFGYSYILVILLFCEGIAYSWRGFVWYCSRSVCWGAYPCKLLNLQSPCSTSNYNSLIKFDSLSHNA